MIRVHGFDLALNHGAIVELDDGDLKNFWFWTDKAAQANRKHGTRLFFPGKVKDRQVKAMIRLAFVRDFLTAIVKHRKPEFVGIEDYAIRAEQGAHYLGEVGGPARLICWDAGAKLRLHDPTSLRMFATLNGNAPKDAVEPAVKERWGVDFSNVRVKKKRKDGTVDEDFTTSGDLADAYAVARLVWTEVQIRSGDLSLKDLGHDKERQVFNRITKTYPINLLDREWICRT
jgi:Holliday junction resolvasome RuvABC endonuclease subunit